MARWPQIGLASSAKGQSCAWQEVTSLRANQNSCSSLTGSLCQVLVNGHEDTEGHGTIPPLASNTQPRQKTPGPVGTLSSPGRWREWHSAPLVEI